MRIYIALLLFALCFGCAPVLAQYTFDVKYPIYSTSSALYRDLYRLTPSKILSNGHDGNLKPTLMTLDNDGMIINQLKLDFNFGSLPFYRYYSNSNIIVMFIADALNNLHQMRLDTNLNVKSDVIIDSSVIGIPSQYKYMGRPKYIMLNDTSILISLFYALDATSPETKRIILQFDQNGKIVNRHTFDPAISRLDDPLFQLPSGKIVWRTSLYDSLKKTHGCLRTSDSKFNFDAEIYLKDIPFNWRSYDYKSIIPTADSGFAMLTSRGVWPVIPTNVLSKFDKDFRKQWEAIVPGVGYDAQHIIESKTGGFYVVTQTITDTTLEYEYPALCFLDISLSRIDVSGRYIFTAYYATGVCTQRPYSTLQDYDGGIIISALYNTQSESPWCEFACDEIDSTWIFKVDTLGRPAKKITGVEEASKNVGNIALYPNPASGKLTVEFGRIGLYSSIEIVDSYGNIIQHIPISDSGAFNTIIDISSLSVGNYFCRLRSPSASITRPFIIQR